MISFRATDFLKMSRKSVLKVKTNEWPLFLSNSFLLLPWILLELGEDCKESHLGRRTKGVGFIFAKNWPPWHSLMCLPLWSVIFLSVFLFVFANLVTDTVHSTWHVLKHYLMKDIQNLSTSYFRSISMLLPSWRGPPVYLFKLLPLLSFSFSWNALFEVVSSVFTSNPHIYVCNVRKIG